MVGTRRNPSRKSESDEDQKDKKKSPSKDPKPSTSSSTKVLKKLNSKSKAIQKKTSRTIGTKRNPLPPAEPESPNVNDNPTPLTEPTPTSSKVPNPPPRQTNPSIRKTPSKKVQVYKGRGAATYTFGQLPFEVVEAAGPRARYINRATHETDGPRKSRYDKNQQKIIKATQKKRELAGEITKRTKKDLSHLGRRELPSRTAAPRDTTHSSRSGESSQSQSLSQQERLSLHETDSWETANLGVSETDITHQTSGFSTHSSEKSRSQKKAQGQNAQGSSRKGRGDGKGKGQSRQSECSNGPAPGFSGALNTNAEGATQGSDPCSDRTPLVSRNGAIYERVSQPRSISYETRVSSTGDGSNDAGRRTRLDRHRALEYFQDVINHPNSYPHNRAQFDGHWDFSITNNDGRPRVELPEVIKATILYINCKKRHTHDQIMQLDKFNGKLQDYFVGLIIGALHKYFAKNSGRNEDKLKLIDPSQLFKDLCKLIAESWKTHLEAPSFPSLPQHVRSTIDRQNAIWNMKFTMPNLKTAPKVFVPSEQEAIRQPEFNRFENMHNERVPFVINGIEVRVQDLMSLRLNTELTNRAIDGAMAVIAQESLDNPTMMSSMAVPSSEIGQYFRQELNHPFPQDLVERIRNFALVQQARFIVFPYFEPELRNWGLAIADLQTRRIGYFDSRQHRNLLIDDNVPDVRPISRRGPSNRRMSRGGHHMFRLRRIRTLIEFALNQDNQWGGSEAWPMDATIAGTEMIPRLTNSEDAGVLTIAYVEWILNRPVVHDPEYQHDLNHLSSGFLRLRYLHNLTQSQGYPSIPRILTRAEMEEDKKIPRPETKVIARSDKDPDEDKDE